MQKRAKTFSNLQKVYTPRVVRVCKHKAGVDWSYICDHFRYFSSKGKLNRCSENIQCRTYMISLVKVAFQASSFVVVCLKSVGVPAKALRTTAICLNFYAKDIGIRIKGLTDKNHCARQHRGRALLKLVEAKAFTKRGAHLVLVKPRGMPTPVLPNL